jgi:ankyrin repeat protein
MTARALLSHLKSAQLGEDEPEAGGVGHAANAFDEPRRAVVLAHGEAEHENEAGGGGGKADDAAAAGTAPVADEDGEPASPTTKTKSVLGAALLVKGAERKEVGGGNGRAADAAAAATSTAGAPVDADKDGEPAPPLNKEKSVLGAALVKGSPPEGVLKNKTSLQMKQAAAMSKLTAVSKMQFSSKKSLSMRGGSVLEDLMAACASRDHSQVHAEFCVRMLTANYSLAKTIGPEGHLPLHALCMAQSHSSYSVVICQALLKANPDAVGVRWKGPGVDFASLPLHLICRQHHLTAYSPEICRLLLAGKEDTCLIPSGGQLPISIALEEHSVVSNHHVTIFRRLLEANRDCVKQKDINGATLVHRLCVSSRKRQHSENITECLRFIFEFNKRIVDADDKSSCKPLHALCKSSFPTEQTVAICEMLLHAAPDAIMQRDDTGKLPLHCLCSNHGLTEVSAQLCRMLLELYVKSASAHDGAGETGGTACSYLRSEKHVQCD